MVGGGLLGLPSLFDCSSPPATRAGSIANSLSTPTFLRATEGPAAPTFSFSGRLGERLAANHRHWLLLAPSRNADMTNIFDATAPFPAYGATDWMGEYAGKYLISAAQGYYLNPDPALKAVGDGVVANLYRYQNQPGVNGYLGPWGRARDTAHWDAWGQYHCILGLLRWYQATGSQDAYSVAVKGADSLRKLGGTSALDPAATADGIARMAKDPFEVTNLACGHVFALLSRLPGTQDYLPFANAVYDRWHHDCVNGGGGADPSSFYLFPSRRWECIAALQMLAELHYAQDPDGGKGDYFQALWSSILASDVHDTGGFSSGEGATGNPYDWRAIETCATIAWMAMTIDMLCMTGRSQAADALEIATWNAVLGAQHPDGHKWTYDTPMGGISFGDLTFAGQRTPTSAELWWQGLPNGPALSCCAMNGPRGLGCLSEWAVLLGQQTIVLNYYGPSQITVTLPSGAAVTLAQVTDYPTSGAIRLTVGTQATSPLTLKLRIPAWSSATVISINGAQLSGIAAGSYFDITRVWSADDIVSISFDMTPRLVAAGTSTVPNSEGSASGKSAVYVGPLLMAYDSRDGGLDPAALPAVDRNSVTRATAMVGSSTTSPMVTLSVSSTAGALTLSDFASAGQSARGTITADILTSNTWQFSRLDGTVLAERMTFLPNGSIGGYSNGNESSWAFDGGDLVFRAGDGTLSSRIFASMVPNGKLVLQGPSLFTPSITHVLSQQSADPFGARSWQFRRADATGTIIASRIQLQADGTITGYPGGPSNNETYWGTEAGNLVFYDRNKAPTTRFTSQRMRHGYRHLSGTFLPDTTITHLLTEIDDDMTTRVWDFWQIPPPPAPDAGADGSTPPPWKFITRLRLLANGSVFRVDRNIAIANESHWRRDGDTIELYGTDGQVSSRFDTLDARPDVTTLCGPYLVGEVGERRALCEVMPPDWSPGTIYSSWLPIA